LFRTFTQTILGTFFIKSHPSCWLFKS